MSRHIPQRQVIQEGKGQCKDCGARVVTILVSEGGGKRTWYSADYAHYGYTVHECGGPRPDPPLREAA